jgi:WhiB family redox-sensing transcriptional regulator
MTGRLDFHMRHGDQLPPWRGDRRIRCRPHTAGLFHAPAGERPPAKRAREAAAKALCAECPRSSDCLDWSLATDQSGIWGGHTPEERAVVARRRAREALARAVSAA